MNLDERIDQFLACGPWAVVGASQDRSKYGNKVLRVFEQNGKKAYPINPRVNEVEGLQAYPDLTSLPERVDGIAVITPPVVTEKVVQEAGRLAIKNVWMQPGAESEQALKLAHEYGMNVISGGPCILVVLRFKDGS